MLAIATPTAQASATSDIQSEQPTAPADAKDLGPSDATQTVTASIILKMHNPSGLQDFIQATVTPGNPRYRQFLSVGQFINQYAPSNAQIHQIINYLQAYGLVVNEVYADNLLLKVTGTVAQFNNMFSTSIHDYSESGRRFHAPKKPPKVPSPLADSVLAIAGLSTQMAAHPLSMVAPQLDGEPGATVVLPKNGTATNEPGSYTVGDVANRYDVTPLYAKGITGRGQTIGIATLANFNPDDAYTYWNTIGLKTKPARIQQVHVDGGGDLGSDAGSAETTLDVEQSGGLAPDANIVVYDAPNTDAGFLDIFYKAISDNRVDTLSVSWGLPEIFYVSALNNGVDYANELQALDQVFMEAAAQGISTFAASGDSGAYDTNRQAPAPAYSTPLTVDAPASDPYITAAGGTTVPFTRTFRLGTVTISEERPWAWDYLQNLGYTGVFSVGDGGGVSVLWQRPWYQWGVPGVKNSEPGQSFVDDTGTTPVDLYDLPANYPGRNVADLSMNADPETGYLLYSSTDGGWIAGYGGTSFVAPQLNGITALLNQYTGGRIGFLNPTLYRLMRIGGYGKNAPFNDINDGDTNWFYKAVNGYDPAVGIGTPNVANLADAIRQGR